MLMHHLGIPILFPFPLILTVDSYTACFYFSQHLLTIREVLGVPRSSIIHFTLQDLSLLLLLAWIHQTYYHDAPVY